MGRGHASLEAASVRCSHIACACSPSPRPALEPPVTDHVIDVSALPVHADTAQIETEDLRLTESGQQE